jgi:hypothetical protein
MSQGIRLSFFDWARFQALEQSLRAGTTGETARLLARGAAHRDPSAATRLAALERRGLPLPGLRMRLALAADPARFAQAAAEWLNELDPDDVESVLAGASATAEDAELPLSIDVLLGLFSASWRGGVWEDGRPAVVAPAPLLTALEGVEPGVRLLSPDAVRDAARGLAEVEIDGEPPAELGPWRDGLDPDGVLDDLARSVLRTLVQSFARAAREGWAMRIVL